ncbi:MAG: hypothetical protein ACYCXG_10270 [Acidiferrobacter sp.]
MTEFVTAIRRAYQSIWTLWLVIFELMGASLVGLHSRTTTIWPFLVWLLCAPLVRLVYLRHLHDAQPPSARLWRMAYGIAAWLLAAGLLLAVGVGVLLLAVGHMRAILAILGAWAGLWGVVPGTLVLAVFLVVMISAIIIWAAMVTVAYVAAAVDPRAGVRHALERGFKAIANGTGIVLGITTTQAALAAAALGAQLLKHSGATLMPMVWPAVLFGPVALVWLLARSESSPRMGARFEV